MPKHKALLLTCLLLAAIAGLPAWSITDSYFGNRFCTPDARSYAMGGTGLFDDLRPSSMSLNPANVTLQNNRIGFGMNLLLNRNEDNRAVPLYNSFDNYTDDAVYASNINWTTDYAANASVSFPLGWFKLGLGAYYRPLLSFDGGYEEEIRNNRNTDYDGYPEKIAQNSIENTGLLNQAAGVASLGFTFGDFVSLDLGADYSLLSGESESVKTIRWSQWAEDEVGAGVLPDYYWMEQADLEGQRLKGGLTLRLGKRFGLAATYTDKAVLDRTGSVTIQQDAYLNHTAVNTSTPIDEDYILPREIRLGLNYQPRNIMRTWFNLEGEYVLWSDIDDHFDDTYNLYAGVEHHIQNRLPLRLGFQATSSYLRNVESDGSLILKKIVTPQITAGSSIPLLENLFLDLGFGYSWREYQALDLFSDTYYNDKIYTGSSSYQLWPNQYISLADRGWENPDKVRESNVSLNTSLSFTW